MNDLEAMKNAAALCNAFGARDETIRAYGVAFKGYDNALMAQAVEYAVENCERLPTVKGVIAMYRKAEQLARVETAAEGVPCAYCKAEGGWRVQGSDRVVPEIRMAVAPYLPGIMVKDDTGMTLGPAWTRLPACASHGLEQARKQGHGGYERPWVKERIDDLREWRDRWEAEHAEHAAAMIERELAAHPSVTSFVAAAVNAPPPESVARTADFAPSVAPEPTQPETSLSVASLLSPGVEKLRRVLDEVAAPGPIDPPTIMVPPPSSGMTPEEEAEFDRGIMF